jgi:hypothetical protein
VSYRDTLEGMIKRTRDPARRAEREAELECPPFPMAARHLFNIFNKIRRRKGSNGFSLSPIEGPDIESFQRRHFVSLAPWEQEIIEMLDDLFLAEQGKAKE